MKKQVYNAKVIVAKNSGFCFGVRRACGIVEELLGSNSGGKIYTIGDIIHNRDYIQRLESMGVKAVTEDNALDVLTKDDTLVIRAHGIPKKLHERLTSNEIGFKVVDATCPFVKKIHKIVDENSASDVDTLIFGSPEHPEVKGIAGYARGRTFIFPDVNAAKDFCEQDVNFKNNCGVLTSQTTNNPQEYEKCKKILKIAYTSLIIFDTICNVTEKRQSEARDLSSKSDIVIVVGGKSSSNTKKLYEICKENCKNVFLIENSDDIDEDEILKAAGESLDTNSGLTVCITAGASTPDDIIEEVKVRMNNTFETNSDAKNIEETKEIKEGMSFDEMLDISMKNAKPRPGEKVHGIITSVTPAAIYVDLGIKYTGVLPATEVTDDTSVDIVKEYKPGDEIDALISKYNDPEGIVNLSRKRLDSDKNWKLIADAFENNETLNGRVIEVVKGGVIMQVGPNRVFVPASQTIFPRSEAGISEEQLKTLVGNSYDIKIIDADASRRRGLGSIRKAMREEQKKLQDKVWAEIEVGKKYTGKVKSITPYGAFVDLGGVDGMVHITELSWKRIKHPSEVVKIGDTVDVFVKALDPEKKRISLGLKTEETNPWNIFKSKYAEGDVADVTIVSLVHVGAFAEIVPGVDGLIHISQISDKKIANPADELKVGEVVKAKITAIDDEIQKVSLSIRALIEPEEEAEVTEAEAASSEDAE